MAITMNNHVFKGHKTLLGKKFVTLAELELPTRYDIFSKSKSGFGWGTRGSSSIQLSFSILYQLTNKKIAEENAVKFTVDIVSKLHSRNWILSSNDVLNWIDKHSEPMVEKIEPTKNVNKINKQKLNVEIGRAHV